MIKALWYISQFSTFQMTCSTIDELNILNITVKSNISISYPPSTNDPEDKINEN